MLQVMAMYAPQIGFDVVVGPLITRRLGDSHLVTMRKNDLEMGAFDELATHLQIRLTNLFELFI